MILYQILLQVGHSEVDRPLRLTAAGQLFCQTQDGSSPAVAVVGGPGVPHQLLLSVEPGSLYHQERTESRPAKQLETLEVGAIYSELLLDLN